MIPWNIDGKSVEIARTGSRDSKRKETENLLITPPGNQKMRRFVKEPLGTTLNILVAPKGYGKTLMLRYRSQWLREHHKATGVLFFPYDAKDIEYLQVRMEPQDLYRLVRPIASAEEWSRIWECALLVVACQTCELTSLGDKELDTIFPYKPSTLKVSSTLATVLRTMNDREKLLSTDITKLRDVFEETGREVAIFIDNADEAFKTLPDKQSNATVIDMDSTSTSSDESRGEVSFEYDFGQDNPKSWNDLQVGLLLAIREIARQTSGLHIYTSLRAEALNDLKDPTAVQAKDHCVPLIYQKSSLRRMLEANINLYDASELADQDAEDPIRRWIGVDRIQHQYVNNPAGSNEEEDLFDFLVRHSLYSPRDLMILGAEIGAVNPKKYVGQPRELEDALQTVINDAAKDLIFPYWKETVIPRWSDYYFDAIGQIQSNVLSEDDLNKLDQAVSSPSEGETRPKVIPFSLFMYHHGLLGTYRNFPGKMGEQIFKDSWNQRFVGIEDRGSQLPSSKYYFIHPILNDVIREKQAHGYEFLPNSSNIIGYDRKFGEHKYEIVIHHCDEYWPGIRYLGKQIFDGPDRITNPRIALTTLLLAMDRCDDQTIPIDTIISVYKELVQRYPDWNKDWIESFRKDKGRLNKSIIKALKVDPNSLAPKEYLVENKGMNGADSLPLAVKVNFCSPGSLFIDPKSRLS